MPLNRSIDARTTIGAVTLRVSNLQKATAFYEDVIGLQLMEHTPTSAILGTPLRPLVYLQHLPHGRFISLAAGLYHLALRVPTRQALANWFGHYNQVGGPHWQGSADHGVSHALYLSDPEGNGIEVYWDQPRARWPQTSDGSLTMYTHALDLQALLGEAQEKDWSGLPLESDMGHIHLKTGSIPSARNFYVDTLGFETMVELSGSALFLAAGGYHHHIGLNTWQSHQAPPLPADAYGLAQYEICFATPEARQAAVDRLQAANHAVEAADSSFIVRDPANIAITLR